MTAGDISTGRAHRFPRRTLTAAMALLVAYTAPAAEPPAMVATSASSGVLYESAARAAAAGDLAPARLLSAALAGGREAGGMSPGAALLLRGSLADLLGDHREAARLFRQGAGRDADADWREAAGYLAVQALEADGDDEAARRAWTRWREDHPNGRLATEAGLRLAWLQLRAGQPGNAAATVAALAEAHPWLRADPAWRRAQAMVDYQQGRPAEALAGLGEDPQGAAPLYLKGLCEAALGNPLAAAAAFQAVATRHQQSQLRDPALFAKADTFLKGGAWRSAAEDFAIVAARTGDADLAAEATVRQREEQLEVVRNRERQLAATVELMKALGGGWEPGRDRPLVDDATRETMGTRTAWKDLLKTPLPPPEAQPSFHSSGSQTP